MDYLENLCAFAPSWQKHVEKCTNFYKNSHKSTDNRYGFSRRGADGKNQIGLSAGPEAGVLE